MDKILFAYSDSSHSHRENNNLGPKTLILDLDETLVHSWENPSFLDELEIYSDPVVYRKFHPTGSHQIAYSMLLQYSGAESRIWGLHRPHLHEFLSFAGEYFDNILVWSAGIQPYVQEITTQIFLEVGLLPPRKIWSRNNCSNYQGYYHKPISELMTNLSNKHYQPFHVDPKTTLILDDKIHTFMENPQNGVLIPAYHPGRNNRDKIPTLNDLLDRSDQDLLKFKKWLETSEVRNSSDVRNLDKNKIF